MKLKKLINKLDGYCFIRVYAIEDWKGEKELDASQMVYSGYVDDLPVYWIRGVVKAIIPCFRRTTDNSDIKSALNILIESK